MKLPLGVTSLGTVDGVTAYLRTLATAIQAGWAVQHRDDGTHAFPSGVWTPADTSGAGLVFVQAEGMYQKTGGLVYAWFKVEYPATANGAAVTIGGLPFAVSASSGSQSTGSCVVSYTTYATAITGYLTSRAVVLYTFGGVVITNANFSTRVLYGTALYQTTT